MMIFSKDIEIARSSPAIIASYSTSLLEAVKSKPMACSIISPIEIQVAAPVWLLFVAKRHPHSEFIS